MERESIEALVDAASAVLELPVARRTEVRAEVVANLERLAAIASALERVEIGPEVEPLTVFVR
jgi:hypothetical protein